LIYEPTVWKTALCGDNFGQQGQRKARRVPSAVLSGSFRIRLSEGTNNSDGWVGGERIDMPDHDMGPAVEHSQDVSTYGKDGFGSVQFVRVMGIIVNDMGDGYGNYGGIGAALPVQADPPLTNHYHEYSTQNSSVFHGFTQNLQNRHLLAPAMTDIFEGYWQDPAGDMTNTHIPQVGDVSDHYYRHEELVTLRYKKNKATGTPNALSNEIGGGNDFGTFTHDPLRGDKRSRNFHVFHDKIISFTPRGTSTSSMNQEGARQHDMKWSVKMTGLRFPQDIRNEVTVANEVHVHEFNAEDEVTGEVSVTVPPGLHTIQLQEATRCVEGVNKRIFWYFLPTISTHVNGYYRGATAAGTDTIAAQTIVNDQPGNTSNICRSNLHHWFTVTRGPEKCFFTEKDDE